MGVGRDDTPLFSQTPGNKPRIVRVIDVHDGDTITNENVRLAGIDACELDDAREPLTSTVVSWRVWPSWDREGAPTSVTTSCRAVPYPPP